MPDFVTKQEFEEFLAALESRLGARLDRLQQSPANVFAEIRRDMRLSLDAVDALRQQTNRRFDETRQNQFREIALALDILRHVRRRIDRVESGRD